MCDPLTATTIALTVASGAAGYVSSVQQANAQQAYQNAQAEEYARVTDLNNKAAQHEYVEQSAAERMNQMQEAASASAEAQKVQREALQKQGEMLASTNASGMALDYLMADYARSEATQKDLIRQQYEFSSVNSDVAVRAYKDRAQSRIDGQQRFIEAPISKPSFLGTALQIASGGLSSYDRYLQRKYKADTAGT